MPRPNQSEERRKQLLPIIVQAFTELGYRRTTTAELASRCQVRENILYRLWPDKKTMFLAAIEYVYDLSAEKWQKILDQNDSELSTAERILDYESRHHGEFGFYRIVFAGLSEVDDPEIRKTLKTMYQRFQSFIEQQIHAHNKKTGTKTPVSQNETLLAWAIIGLGTVANISREIHLLSKDKRRRLISDVGRILLDGPFP